MKEQDLEAFGVALSTLAVGTRFDLADNHGLIDVYWAKLQRVDIATFQDAVSRAMDVFDRFPSVHQLLDLCGVLEPESLSSVAWTQVVSAVGSYGSTRAVDFEDRCINAAIRSMGGWTQLCSSPEEWFLNWGAKEFKKAYAAYARQGIPDGLGESLPGRRFDVPREPKRIAATEQQRKSLPPEAIGQGCRANAVGAGDASGRVRPALRNVQGRDGQGDGGVRGTVDEILRRAREARERRER